MTNKTKYMIKRLASDAFEMCVGSTIYTYLSNIEVKAINKLYSAIKNKTTETICIRCPVDGIATAQQPDVLLLKALIIDYMFDIKKASVKSLNLVETTDLGSMYLFELMRFASPSKVIFYRGTPILILLPSNQRCNNQSVDQIGLGHRYSYLPRGSAHEMPGILFRNNHLLPVPEQPVDLIKGVRLITINSEGHKNNLNRFIKSLRKRAERFKIEESKSAYLRAGNSNPIKKRHMDSVFMDSEMKDDLIKTLDYFVSRKDWYDKNFVPYHFGILLYGPPGTGKSTLIRALLTEYYEKYPTALSPYYASNMRDLMDIGSSTEPGQPKLVILEDIDAVLLQARKPNTKTVVETTCDDDVDCDIQPLRFRNDISMSEVLNSIDGVANTENIIYIFTTNCVDKLDPALLRPGRIDKLVKIDKPNRDSYDQFLYYHFGKHIPDDVVVKEDKLIAELQNEIVCEKTFDEILDLIREN